MESIGSRGILLVGFGNQSQLTAEVRACFPDAQVVVAQTVREGLARIQAREVWIQPVFLLPGFEYERLCREARFYPSSVAIGQPLLHSPAAMEALGNLLAREYAAGAAVCVGHGSRHSAGKVYGELAAFWREQGRNIFLGLLEGEPDFETMAESIRQKGVRQLALVPLMMTAGKHVRQEILGSGRESWRRRLEALGLEINCVRRGLCDYPAVRQMILASLRPVFGAAINRRHV
jgi:sirohydrochlorin cobaltochelatase